MANEVYNLGTSADGRNARTVLSWGSLIAGLFVALTVFLTLSMLGSAVRISPQTAFRAGVLAVGRSIWASCVFAFALFVGGWVTNRAIGGEDRVRASLHGIVLWGLSFPAILLLGFLGANTGIVSILVAALTPANPASTGAGWWMLGTMGVCLITAIAGNLTGPVQVSGPSSRRLAGDEARAA